MYSPFPTRRPGSTRSGAPAELASPIQHNAGTQKKKVHRRFPRRTEIGHEATVVGCDDHSLSKRSFAETASYRTLLWCSAVLGHYAEVVQDSYRVALNLRLAGSQSGFDISSFKWSENRLAGQRRVIADRSSDEIRRKAAIESHILGMIVIGH